MLNRRIFLSTVAAFAVAAPTAAFAILRLPQGPAALGDGGGATELTTEERARRVSWLQTNSAKLNSVDFGDDDFSDLEPFRKAVGDARIVMLGEMSHGDGTTFRAKARMVRFLHEEMGFDVLAFESGLYDMHKVWERIRNGESAHRAVRRGMHGVWSGSRQMRPLFDYIGKHENARRPLELAGFDCQFAGSVAREDMLDDLASFLKDNKIDIESIAYWPRFRRVMNRIMAEDNDGSFKPSTDDQKIVLSTFDALIERIAASEDDDAEFWRQVLKSNRRMVEILFRADVKDPGPADLNARDAAMARNLIWLARQAYPKRKIIVWAAAYHNARNYQSVDPNSTLVPMGQLVSQELGDQVYSAAFTAFEGHTGWNGQQEEPLTAPARNSLEDLWGATALKLAFLDLRHVADGGDWLKSPFGARPLSEETVVADWSKVLDGMVFLRTMRRSRLAD